MPKELTLKSHAKINLNLRLLGLREDGFHEIDSVMQSISLYDLVTLKQIDKGIQVICDLPEVPSGKENLAYKAAEKFIQETRVPRGIQINVEKNIPVAAGLAGGSSNAAAVLVGLNDFWNMNLSLDKLMTLGEEIGSDVPFCIKGGTARCTGKGETVQNLTPIPKTWMVLIKPDIKIKASWAYETYDLEIGFEEKRVRKGQSFLGFELLNDLEEVALEHYPQIAEIKSKLIKLGATASLMAGSGPTVFGITKDRASARGIFDQFKKEYKGVYYVITVPQGVEVLGAGGWEPEIQI